MEERRKVKQIEKFDEDGNLEYTIIPNYKIHENFMTQNEMKFYNYLISAVNELDKQHNIHLTIFAQVAVNRLIEVNNNRNSKLWENICDKSIDFVLYEKKLNKVYCCIELNDETHHEPKRIKRDEMLKKALNSGDVKMIFIEKQENYNVNEIMNTILECNKKAISLL